MSLPVTGVRSGPDPSAEHGFGLCSDTNCRNAIWRMLKVEPHGAPLLYHQLLCRMASSSHLSERHCAWTLDLDATRRVGCVRSSAFPSSGIPLMATTPVSNQRYWTGGQGRSPTPSTIYRQAPPPHRLHRRQQKSGRARQRRAQQTFLIEGHKSDNPLHCFNNLACNRCKRLSAD